MYCLLRYLPKNYLSWLAGRLARLRLPAGANQALLRWFSRRYGVRIDEIARPLEDYDSLSSFFLRDLKEGARPIGDGIVCPVDGRLEEIGIIENGRLLQVKGKYYSAAKLLCSEELAREFEGGVFATFYLAPGDYHHIHSPVDGSIVESIHAEGTLWPVNSWSVANIPELFTINERITTVIDSAAGKTAVVKVGATNVGSITTTYNVFVGNAAPRWFTRRAAVHRERFPEGIPIRRGERLGSFRMGSTVVLLVQKDVLAANQPRGPVTFGSALPLCGEHMAHG